MSKTSANTRICGSDAESITLRGKDLVDEVIGEYGFTQAFLLQSLGIEATPQQIALVEAVMVTIMEHGLTPSAVATRMSYLGAPDSFQGAIAAGLLAVGDRYAGTAGLCGALAEQIIAAEDRDAKAAELVAEHRAARRPIPGFGHPIHTGRDPRVAKLIAMLDPEGDALQAMLTLERALSANLGRELVMNVSSTLAALLLEAGVPAKMMRGVILVARCAGLVGHVVEEMENPAAQEMWQAAEASAEYLDPGA